MLPHQQRVIDEKSELDLKINKLSTFISGKIFKTLSTDEQVMLKLQFVYMVAYSNILQDRIKFF